MQFLSILSAVIALSLTAFAVPTQGDAGASIEARNPDSEDWKTALGWNGTVSPIESVGTILEKRDDSELEQLEKRTPGGLYLCQAFNFGAPCAYVVFSHPGDCLILADPEWRYTLSSLGPDTGICYLYWSQDCSGTSSPGVSNPGRNLQGDAYGYPNYWGMWNDYTGSIKCYF